MNNLPRTLLVVSAFVAVFFGAFSFYLAKQDYVADSVIFDTDKNIAIYGYDTVSYYSEDKPVLGNETFQANWAGSIWYFSSLKNRDLFAAKPENYAPQYGGYDPVGISEGYTNPTDPEQYTVLAGMLFLHYSPAYKEHWQLERGKNMILANSNWAFLRPQLLKRQNDQ
ncbi:MAG: YHS domain protein [Kordiimonadaceae bacterium]|jgi:YHS domain-containing protein|nr:YHS domain protein [Kordiimonadaceae bacterium]MBT6037256.1 YHS domain protein [Kordiimonadaceae bacterium]MBT6329602.1 YHS domain protein [Kordiimonadaceae bacterium]MBT7583260.1 YHS domain protein [Kordiimonadaceae bacterium]